MSKAKELVSQMTLAEKASLLSGADFWRLKSVERLGLPTIMVSDGPHGLRKQADEGDHLGIGDSVPATCFPPACTTASSWDPALVEEMGEAIGEEAQAESLAVVLGPGANIKRSPLCGRNFEYFSEDPYLTGKMAAAWIDGVQSTGTGVSLKHFAANNQERARLIVNATVDERALREIYLAGFETAVKNAHPRTVMCSYNKLDNISVSRNKRLLTDILRTEWGFNGLVMSDWGAVNNRIDGVAAGLDLEMPGTGGVNDARVVAAVRAGTLAEADVDKCAERVVQLILDSVKNKKPNAVYDKAAHHALARKVAANSAVLLQNSGALPAHTGMKAAVLGAFAVTPRYQGAGSSKIHPTMVTAPLDALREAGMDVSYAEGYAPRAQKPDNAKIAEAVAACEGKDIVFLFAGLPDACESEGWDRSNIQMPESHTALIEAVAAAHKNVVLILQCGSPVAMPWRSKVNAILLAYLGGQAGGDAVADVLLGKVNPSGHLAETWPLCDEDTPTHLHFPGGTRSAEYRESIFVGYRYYDTAQKAVQYPFGYGLSYTAFTLRGLTVNANSFTAGETLTVTACAANTGSAAGACVAQLYVGRKADAVMRPEKELKAFAKVFLAAGESKQITFTLDSRSFAYYNTECKDWAIEGGTYTLHLALDSRTVCESAQIQVTGDGKETLVKANRSTVPTYFALPQGVFTVSTEEFARLYAHKLPPLEHLRGELFGQDTCLADLHHTLKGRVLHHIAKKQVQASYQDGGIEDMQMMAEASMMHMPLRSLCNMGGGGIAPDMVDGVADILNGHYIKGWKKVKPLLKKK